MRDRFRVWADIEAPTADEAEYLLRETLDKRSALVYGATGKTAYNGWKNYETWAVMLWLDNEEESYAEVREITRQAFTDANEAPGGRAAVADRNQIATRDLATRLQELVADGEPTLGASLYADLLNAAMGEVDWYELAEHLIAEVRE